MAKRISQLTQITRAQIAVGDLIPVVDISAGQTKYATISDLTGLPDVTWTATAETWTYSSWTAATNTAVFTVPTDATTKYSVGMLIRFSQTTGGTKYGTITAVTATTVTAILHSGYTLNNETVTSPMYTSLAAPYGAGAIVLQQLKATALRLGLNSKVTIGTVIANGFTTYATVTATSTGGPVELDYRAKIRDGSSGSVRTGSMRVQCDGVTVTDTTLFWRTPISDAHADPGMIIQHTPAAGAHTWTFQLTADTASASLLDQATLKVREVR